MTLLFPPGIDDETQQRTREFFKEKNADERIALIEKGICLAAQENIMGLLPLHIAVITDMPDVVQLLLEQGASTEAWSYVKLMAMHHAAEMLNETMITLLVKAGADINAQTGNGHGTTPFSYCLNGMYGDGQDANPEAIKLFLQAGNNIYWQNVSNRCAAYYDSVKDFTRIWVEDYEEFAETRVAPASKQEIYRLLAVWPLANPKAPVDKDAHLQQLFSYAKWRSLQQAHSLIRGLETDDRRFPTPLAESLRAIVNQQFMPLQRPKAEIHQGARMQ